MPMQKEILGITTSYQDMGKGPVLVFLHGWGCDWQIWYPLVAPLSETYRLILLDLPAFGQSSTPPTPWQSPNYAAWLTATLEELIPREKFVLIGHSFGGKVATYFVADNSVPVASTPTTTKAAAESTSIRKQLKALVLIDSGGLPAPLSTRQKIQQRIVSLIPAGIKHALSAQLKAVILDKLGAATDHLRSTPAQREILRATIHERVDELLPRVHVPTLLIWGEHDQDTPLKQGHQFSAGIPFAQLTVIPHAKHFPFLDQPQATLQELQSFLAEVWNPPKDRETEPVSPILGPIGSPIPPLP